MEKFLGRYSEAIYALFRFMAGVMFLLHGTQKLFGFPGGRDPVELISLPGRAGVIESVGGTLIALGLFASYAAFIASGEMATAYFMVHWPKSLFPLLNEGETAALYCFAFLYIAAKGSGRFSLDAAFRRRRSA
jgi:putative oxidoreductase